VPFGDLPNVTPDTPDIACKKFAKDFDMKYVFESIFGKGNQNINQKTFPVCKKLRNRLHTSTLMLCVNSKNSCIGGVCQGIHSNRINVENNIT
jgi:hypothetical protein